MRGSVLVALCELERRLFCDFAGGRPALFLPLSVHPPERTRPEPCKCQREYQRSRKTSRSGLSRMESRVLAKKSEGAESRHRQKHGPHHFEPKLMRDARKRTQRGRDRTLPGADRAISSSLLSCHPRHNAEFLPGSYFAHGLDFNSLEVYNDATDALSEPFFMPPHLRIEGEMWIRN